MIFEQVEVDIRFSPEELILLSRVCKRCGNRSLLIESDLASSNIEASKMIQVLQKLRDQIAKYGFYDH